MGYFFLGAVGVAVVCMIWASRMQKPEHGRTRKSGGNESGSSGFVLSDDSCDSSDGGSGDGGGGDGGGGGGGD